MEELMNVVFTEKSPRLLLGTEIALAVLLKIGCGDPVVSTNKNQLKLLISLCGWGTWKIMSNVLKPVTVIPSDTGWVINGTNCGCPDVVIPVPGPVLFPSPSLPSTDESVVLVKPGIASSVVAVSLEYIY